jgi:YD repeat-containing protein
MNKKYERYIDYIVNDIEVPYIKSLEPYGLKQEEYELVLSKVFNQPVTIISNRVYDTNGNVIYYENNNGYWVKYGYDQYGNVIYYENNTGYWSKYGYDINGNVIYREDSYGVIEDNR